MGNKYDVEQIILEVPGRNCANGGRVTSQHDRRFIWSGDEFLLDDVWGKHGACVAGSQPNELPRVNCNTSENMEGTSKDILHASLMLHVSMLCI